MSIQPKYTRIDPEDPDRWGKIIDIVWENYALLTMIGVKIGLDGDSFGLSHSKLLDLISDDHLHYILVAGTRAFTGNQSMGSNKLTSLSAGTSASDAIRRDQAFKFKTIDCPSGTDPVSAAIDATLKITSADSSVTVTGDNTADPKEIDVVVNPDNIDFKNQGIGGILLNVGSDTVTTLAPTSGVWTTLVAAALIPGDVLNMSLSDHQLTAEARRTAGSGDVELRIFDITNTQVIATIASITASSFTFFETTTFSNLPTDNATIRAEFRTTDGSTSGEIRVASWVWEPK